MDISSLTPDKQVKLQYWLNIPLQCSASGLAKFKLPKAFHYALNTHQEFFNYLEDQSYLSLFHTVKINILYVFQDTFQKSQNLLKHLISILYVALAPISLYG